MSHPLLLVIFGLILNASGSFIMLRWQVLPNAVMRDAKSHVWYEVFGWTNKPAPKWKVRVARLGPALLLLGFLAQLVGAVLSALSLD